jgi:hypothetical protein
MPNIDGRGERGTVENGIQWDFWEENLIIHYFSHIYGSFHAQHQQFYVYTFDIVYWYIYFDIVNFKILCIST